MMMQIKEATTGLTSLITFKLSRAQNKLNAQASYFLKTHSNLSLVEWRILQLIRLFPGASMSTLATEVEMDRGQLSRKINAMIAKELIQSEPDKEDHRKQNIFLTDAAKSVIDQMKPIMQKRQALLIDGISDADLKTFFKVLTVIDQAAEFRDMS